ncbi:MAG: hypothetical protein ACYTEK_22015 [Planctomycetota bacterium]|jgi:hypothetical protein
MKTDKTQKRSSKSLVNGTVILAAIVALLMMQGAAQAWWLVWRGGW